MSDYIPGVCNINHAEIAYRRKVAYIGAIISVALLTVLLAVGLNRWVRLVLFLPIFVSAINSLQVKNKFCVMYGGSGQQNATDGSPTASAVTDEAALKKDKQRSRQMNTQAAIIAVLITLVSLVV